MEKPRTYRFGFVKIPDDGMVFDLDRPNPNVVFHTDFKDLEAIQDCLRVQHKVDDFSQTGNPVAAIEAFVIAFRRGLYPSPSVLEWLCKAFEEYHEKQGLNTSLDELLGLRKTGPGKRTPIFEKEALNMRDEMLLFDMDVIMFLGGTRELAAEAVSARLHKTDWNKSQFDMADVSATTLIDKHKKSKRRKFKRDDLLLLLSEESLQLFFAKFKPAGLLPDRHHWMKKQWRELVGVQTP